MLAVGCEYMFTNVRLHMVVCIRKEMKETNENKKTRETYQTLTALFYLNLEQWKGKGKKYLKTFSICVLISSTFYNHNSYNNLFPNIALFASVSYHSCPFFNEQFALSLGFRGTRIKIIHVCIKPYVIRLVYE